MEALKGKGRGAPRPYFFTSNSSGRDARVGQIERMAPPRERLVMQR